MSDVAWFGPWFGDGLWFGPWFPDLAVNRTLAPGYGPSGVAVLVASIETSFELQLSWKTDIIPRGDDTEQRIADYRRPRQSFKGVARLVDDQLRSLRNTFEQWAAEGQPFLLALPYEEITVSAASGTSLTVGPSAITGSDWAKVGQRAVLVSADAETNQPVVIQDATGTNIEVDVDVSAFGFGARLMPAIAVLLEPQQGLIRFSQDEQAGDLVEEWQLAAMAVVFDYVPTRASLALSGVTSDPALTGVTLYARTYGEYGNATSFSLIESSAFFGTPDEGLLEEGVDIYGTLFVNFSYVPGVTTMQNFADALAASVNIVPGGSYVPSATISTGAGFLSEYLSGAESAGDFGKGASLTTYEGRPVWDRPIQIAPGGTANEAMNAGTVIVDVGAVPSAVKMATAPTWARFVRIADMVAGSWQWLKLFLGTVRGAQKGFWLPTWRNDLAYVSHAPGEIIVNPRLGMNPEVWLSRGYSAIRVTESDGTIHYLTISGLGEAYDEDSNPLQVLFLTTSPTIVDIAEICWLELVRFESDRFSVNFDGPRFSMQTQARVIR